MAVLAVECGDEELVESKGSVRLGKRVEAMIGKVDQALQNLGSEFVTSGSDNALNKMQEECM